MARDRLLDGKTFLAVTRTFAVVREPKKCVEVFHLANRNGWEYSLETLNMVVENLCRRKLIKEAHDLVVKLKEVPELQPDSVRMVGQGVMRGWEICSKISLHKLFREMIRRGCEPTMHTYIMLLHGHLGKRGLKGPEELVNFDSIFVGGLVKAGKWLEATKYVERAMERSLEVPRFDYNKFLHYYSNDEGVAFFEEVSKKLREADMVDLADILTRYGEKMATHRRRIDHAEYVKIGMKLWLCSYCWMLHHGKFSSMF